MAEHWSRMTGLTDRNTVFNHKTSPHSCCKWWHGWLVEDEALRGVSVVYVYRIGTESYEIMLQWPKKTGGYDSVEWIGKACCKDSAIAKSLADFKQEYR